MKSKLLIVNFSFLLSVLLFTSFRCTTSRWLFIIEVKPLGNKGDVVDNLELRFYPSLFDGNTELSFYPTYKYVDGVKSIDSYNVVLYNCIMSDVPLEKRYSDWDKLQPILDNYEIKITDPSGVYKDYTIPSIRNLIENSEYKDRNLSSYDDEGNVLPEALTFTINLEE